MVNYPPQGVIPRGVREETASYIIFKVGTTYYAKNGETGAIEFSGTDLQTVYENARDQLTQGLIIIKCDGSLGKLVLKERVAVVGLGKDVPTLTLTNTSGWGIESEDPTAVKKFLHLENFRFKGNANLDGGLRVERVQQSLFSKLRLFDFTKSTANGVLLADDSYSNHFDKIITENIGNAGLRTESGANGRPNACRHIDCLYFGKNYGGDIDDGAQLCLGTEFHNETDSATSYGLRCNHNTVLIDCWVEQVTGKAFEVTAVGRLIAIGGYYAGGAGLVDLASGGTFIYIDRNDFRVYGFTPKFRAGLDLEGSQLLNPSIPVNITLFSEPNGYTKVDPGTSYVPLVTGFRSRIDFRKFKPKYASLSVVAQGNEVGPGKGVRVYDVTNGVVIAEATWDGTVLQNPKTTAWASFTSPNTDSIVEVQVKGSSLTEDITVYFVELRFY